MYCPAWRILLTKSYISRRKHSFLKCYKKLAHTYFTPITCQALLQDGHKILRAAVKDNDSKLGNFRNQANTYYTI